MRRRSNQDGTVLIVLMVLLVSFGGLAMTSLSVMVGESRKHSKRLYARQAQLMANAQLEVAKNLVNAANYDVYMNNLVLRDALDEPNQVIPNTQVRVEQVGTTNYYVLRTTAQHQGVSKSADAIVRQVSPASGFNLFVIDHPVGLSGAPRGAIHTNKYVDFFFPGGLYRDRVTASEGFRFVAGAAPGNTTFAGATNPNAPQSNLLDGVDFDALWAKADVLAVTEDLVAEIQLNGDTAEAKLYMPEHDVTVVKTRTVTEFSHYETETYIEPEPIYETVTYTEMETVYRTEDYIEIESEPVYAWRDATRTVTEPIYEDQTVTYTENEPVYATQTVQEPQETLVWVSYEDMEGGASSSGGTVGATTQAGGYWKKVTEMVDVEQTYISGYTPVTKTRTETVKIGDNVYDEVYSEQYVDYYEDVSYTRQRQVPDGEIEVTKTRQEITGWEDVTKTRQVKVYTTTTEEYEDTETVAETLVRTETFPVNGTVYFKGDVRKLGGDVNGRLSLITSGEVNITDNITYVDTDGDPRMQNGKDKTKPYIPNPDYNGESLMAIMADGDITYSKDAPTQLEVNASLVSANGSVSFENIEVSEDGTDVWVEGSSAVLESLRRLGGVVSRFRPVATYIDELGFIAAGFESGASVMDQNLILSSGNNAPPPFMFESPVPTWIMSTAGQRIGTVQ